MSLRIPYPLHIAKFLVLQDIIVRELPFAEDMQPIFKLTICLHKHKDIFNFLYNMHNSTISNIFEVTFVLSKILL